MSNKVDSWHQVSAGGKKFAGRFHTGADLAALSSRGSLMGGDPALFWEMAEEGRFDYVLEGDEE